jgi:hypothetical protein
VFPVRYGLNSYILFRRYSVLMRGESRMMYICIETNDFDRSEQIVRLCIA